MIDEYICRALMIIGLTSIGGCHQHHGDRGEEPHQEEQHKEGHHEEQQHKEGHHEEQQHKEGHHEEGDRDEEKIIELSAAVLKTAGVITSVVERRKMPHVLKLTGELDYAPRAVVRVAPRLSGNIIKTYISLGEEVKAGTLMAEIRSAALSELKVGFLAARERYRIRSRNQRRLIKLRKQLLIKESEVVEARAQTAATKAEVSSFRERLRVVGFKKEAINALVFAGKEDLSVLPVLTPVAGRVIKLRASRGEYVSPEEEPLAVIADASELDLWVHVSSRDISHLHRGNEVLITTPAWPGQNFKGVVDYLGHRVNDLSRLLRARVRVPNQGGRLRPGMLVTAAVTETEPHGRDHPNDLKHIEHHPPASLTVPDSSVRYDKEGSFVFVELRSGHFKRTPVRIGRSYAGFTVILDGVDLGKRVVTRGAFLIGSEGKKSELGHGHAH